MACPLATAILDSCFLFYLPKISMCTPEQLALQNLTNQLLTQKDTKNIILAEPLSNCIYLPYSETECLYSRSLSVTWLTCQVLGIASVTSGNCEGKNFRTTNGPSSCYGLALIFSDWGRLATSSKAPVWLSQIVPESKLTLLTAQ